MSRLAKKPIKLNEKTSAKFTDGSLNITGPLGALSLRVDPKISVALADDAITVSAPDTLAAGPMLGTTAAHIRNIVAGVNKAYEKKLVIEGIGFKAEVKGDKIVFSLGFSHPVSVPIPQGLKVTVEKNNINISGIDKNIVGQFAASLRDLKKPEPYKGKGIMYATETIRRKQGKKAV